MSKVSDIATIALVGGLGVGAYAIYKNSDKIGKALGDIGNILNPAGLFDTIGSELGSIFDGLFNNGGGSSTNDLGNKLPELSPNRLFPDEENVSDKTKLEVIETILPGTVSILPGLSGVKPIEGATSGKSIVDAINEATLNRASTPVNPSVESAAAAAAAPIVEPAPTPIVEKTPTPAPDISAIKKESARQVALMNRTKEETENLPTKTITELASQDNFTGRVFSYVFSKVGL